MLRVSIGFGPRQSARSPEALLQLESLELVLLQTIAPQIDPDSLASLRKAKAICLFFLPATLAVAEHDAGALVP